MSGIIYVRTIEPILTLTDTPVIVWDMGVSNRATLTLAGANRTLQILNPIAGMSYLVELIQDATGGRSIAVWPPGTKWLAGTPPALSAAPNAVDVLTFYYNGVNFYGRIGNGFG